MEEESPVKASVAELAGRLRARVLPMPGNTEMKSMRRSPCSLQLNNQRDKNTEHEKPSICPHPPKMKIKSSPLIEKLQANLALSPTVLLSPPKSPEATKQPPNVSNPSSPCSSRRSTLQPVQLSQEDEVPVSFEQPAEGTPLPSINKSRARLSFKRRLPTRQHRKAYMEDESSRQPDGPRENGDGEEVLGEPLPEDEEDKMTSSCHLTIIPTNDPEREERDEEQRDGMKNRNALQENERTEVTQTENDQQITEEDEHHLCEHRENQEPDEEDTAEDQTEMQEKNELLDTEKNPEEK